MVFEVEVAVAMTLLGLLGLLLLPFRRTIRNQPTAWLGFFVGVFLYLVLHDATDAFRNEVVVREAWGPLFSFSLVAIALLVGGGTVTILVRPKHPRENPWPALLLFAGAVLALHASLDALVLADALGALTAAEVLNPGPVALQVVHRFLEGGVLAALFLVARIPDRRLVGGLLYVSLPFLAILPAAALDFLQATVVATFLGFTAVSAFFVLLLVGLWPALSRQWVNVYAAQWLLAGFFATFAAHALGHGVLGV